jgi:hypothetical protein
MHVIEYRWWPVDDLSGIPEPVIPRQAAGLVPQLLEGHYPDDPIALPWT